MTTDRYKSWKVASSVSKSIYLRALVGGIMLAYLGEYAQAANVQQFDLICSGAVTSFPLGQIGAPDPVGPGLPYTTRLRIDLDRKMFCQDECKLPEGIELVQQDQLVLRHTEELLGYDDFAVSRIDGTFQTYWYQKANDVTNEPFELKHAQGTCAKAKYSIVPANVF